MTTAEYVIAILLVLILFQAVLRSIVQFETLKRTEELVSYMASLDQSVGEFTQNVLDRLGQSPVPSTPRRSQRAAPPSGEEDEDEEPEEMSEDTPGIPLARYDPDNPVKSAREIARERRAQGG